jgi:hypothetical protein
VKTRIAHIDGASATGTPHGVLVETADKDVLVTITGADGKKRHATSIVADVAALITALQMAQEATA